MQSLTESPFVLIVIGLIATMTLAVFFVQTKEKRLLPFIIGALCLTLIPMVTDALVVTDREALKLSVQRLARSIQSNDIEKTLEYSHPDAPHVYASIEKEMPNYKFTWCAVTRFKKIEVAESGRTANVTFIVTVNVEAKKGPTGAGFREVMLEMAKDSKDAWKIKHYRHYSPGSRSF